MDFLGNGYEIKIGANLVFAENKKTCIKEFFADDSIFKHGLAMKDYCTNKNTDITNNRLKPLDNCKSLSLIKLVNLLKNN